MFFNYTLYLRALKLFRSITQKIYHVPKKETNKKRVVILLWMPLITSLKFHQQAIKRPHSHFFSFPAMLSRILKHCEQLVRATLFIKGPRANDY